MQIGNIRNGTKSFSNPQSGRVYDIEDVSPTLKATTYKDPPKVMIEELYDEDLDKTSNG